MNAAIVNDLQRLQRETQHLTDNNDVFPELVWKQVLEKITAPDDIENCYNASPYFCNVLKSKHQSYVVLPKVLEQLSRFYHKQGYTKNNDKHSSKISPKDFWKLRQTCASWNIIIQNLHQSRDAGHFIMKYDWERFRNIHVYNQGNNVFDQEALPQELMWHFDATHYNNAENKSLKNPCLGRSVRFRRIRVANLDQNEYLVGISEILGKYGEEIWYADFDFRDAARLNLQDIYRRLHEYLSLLPNLKVLRVAYKEESDRFPGRAPGLTHILLLLSQRLLDHAINQDPLPNLPNLEFISTTNLPTPIFNELLRANRHIRKLEVDRKPNHGEYNIFQESLPNLKVLSLQFWSEKHFKQFENCEHVLKLDNFYLLHESSSWLLRWNRLFDVLERKLGTSCKELLLKMPVLQNEFQCKLVFHDTCYGSLKLKKLEQIQIISDATICLDFLLPTKSFLRGIALKDWNGDEDKFYLKCFDEFKEVQFVKLIGYKERMEQSNIWTEFPKLETLTLFRKREMGGCVRYKCESVKEEYCKLEKKRWNGESEENTD